MILFHAEANIFSFPLVNVFIKKKQKKTPQAVYYLINFLLTVT